MSARDDYFTHILRANGDPLKLDKILQENCRRKAAKKLAATLAVAPDFKFPTELSAEQCTADVIADFHASLIPEGSKVVDLTAGLGIDDFHIAKRASSVLSIEINHEVAKALKPNAQALGMNNVESLCEDSTMWLQHTQEKFDIAFIDPARRADDGSRLYSLADCRPDVTQMLDNIEAIASKLYIKASPMLDISKTVKELGKVSKIFAVGTESECKELLIEIDFKSQSDVRIFAVTIGHHIFEVSQKEKFEPTSAKIEKGDIIGEPWPAVFKVQPHGLFPRQLHSSTLLYLNPEKNFPGQFYEVDRVEEFSSSTVKKLAREGIEASVAVRNFPLSADSLRKKLRAKESQNVRLMATMVASGERVLLFMHKIQRAVK